MKLDSDFLERWAAIVNDVEKQHCPVSCVKKIVFRFVDNKQKTINFKKLRAQGLDDRAIENAIADYIASHEPSIGSMELVLDIEAVASIVQPETDKLLKGMG
jgi:Asp-tRNA(Asn)/Glu-tRNA(Gln) amidotransferase B subunit